MEGFSDKQIQQLQDLLTPLSSRLSGVESRLTAVDSRLSGVESRLSGVDSRLSSLDYRLSDIDKQQGDLWETSVRQAVQTQYGHSFSKEFTITSLQHLARLVCRSTGWSAGSDAVDICHISERLAAQLLDSHAAERVLQGIFTVLTKSAGRDGQFVQLGQRLQANPWFDSRGCLDLVALGRSLPAFEAHHQGHIKSRLEKLHRLLTSQRSGSNGCLACHAQPFGKSSLTFQCGCSGQVQHLLNCRSAGVFLALYEAEPTAYTLNRATSFKQLADSLPFLQLQMDVRGRYTIINNKVTIEVGEIKRNLKKYHEAKKQLMKRAKLIKWAISAAVDEPMEFVLIGHLFVPRSKPDDNIPGNEINDYISIFVHQI